MALQAKSFRAQNLDFVIDKQITFLPAQDMKPAEAFMQNKMQLFKQGWINAKMQQCTFGDTISFAFYANALLFNLV